MFLGWIANFLFIKNIENFTTILTSKLFFYLYFEIGF